MAAAHRRGGRHAVKDEDLTHTKYDHYTREELIAIVKEAGCYIKDDRKSTMARKLAQYDQGLQFVARRTAQEQKETKGRKQQKLKEAAKAKKSRESVREKHNNDRGRRRERGEDVSSNSEDTVDADEQDRYDAQQLTVTGGEALSDETWEDTPSETTIRSRNPSIEPECKLRLFEWPYVVMPPKSPLPCPAEEQFPRQLTYAPLKLITTQTSEKVTLPGLKYPAGVDPDYVPVLDPLTRSAARHGHMIGLLAHATIEPASTWASRTLVQGWNGRIYFSLPPRDDAKDRQLTTVYQKWHLENAKLLQPTPGNTDPKTNRKHRFAQRLMNQRKRVADVYEACQWRPLAVCYMPSYLDWEKDIQCGSLEHIEKSIQNLYYIRFPGCDLPHYYFWARKSEWSDPATPDTAWTTLSFQQNYNRQALASADLPPPQAPLRIKKPVTLPPLCHDFTGLSNFDVALSSVEFELYTQGLSATLSKYKTFAVSTGKEQAWSVFTHKLPLLYPSGELPDKPPVYPAKGMCVAEKIAALKLGRIFLPLNGEESWTRNDDAAWDIIADENHIFNAEPQSLHSAGSSTMGTGVNALYRRDSMDVLIHPQDQRIYDWLDNISTAYPPIIEPLSPTLRGPKPNPDPPSPICPPENANKTPTCPFCNTNWIALKEREKAEHMLAHSHTSLIHTTTAPSLIHAIGVGAKRRHSQLSISTLRSYSAFERGRKLLRLDSAAYLAERWAKLGRNDSPFTKEVKRIRALEMSWGADLGLENEVQGKVEVGEERDENEWFGDDEGEGDEE